MVAEAIELKPLMDPTSEHSVEPQSIVFDYDLDEDYTQRPPGSSTSRNETNSKVSVATASPLSGWPAARNFYKRNEGFMLIGLSQLFFASINTLVKLLQIKVEIPVWEVIWVRMSVTGVGAVYYMVYSGVEHPYWGPPGVRFLLCIRGIVGFGGLFSVYFSLRYLSLSDATVLTFLAPVLVGVLASIFLKEPYSKLEFTTAMASLFGVLLIAKPSFLSFILGTPKRDDTGPGGSDITAKQRTSAIIVALAGVFGAAGAYLLIRKIGKRANALHSISYFSAYCVIVSSLYPIFFDSPPVFIFDWTFVLLMFPIGILGFGAQFFLTLGLQRERAGRGTLAVYSNLIFAMILEYLVFGNLMDAWSLVGSVIIIGGAVMVVLDKQSVPQKGSEGRIEEGRVYDVVDEEDDEVSK